MMKQPRLERSAEGCCCTRYFYDISFDVAFHSSALAPFFYTFPLLLLLLHYLLLLHLRIAASVSFLRRINKFLPRSCQRPFPISFFCLLWRRRRRRYRYVSTFFSVAGFEPFYIRYSPSSMTKHLFSLSFLPAGFLVKRHDIR